MIVDYVCVWCGRWAGNGKVASLKTRGNRLKGVCKYCESCETGEDKNYYQPLRERITGASCPQLPRLSPTTKYVTLTRELAG